MKIIKALLLACALVVSASAAARTPEPVVNYSNLAIAPASGKALSAADVQQLIKSAAETRKWVISGVADGKMLAKKSWNNKHTIIVDISYSPTSYSIVYRDSIDMKYQTLNGVTTIHPHYNRFVRELVEAIRLDLTML